MTDGCTVFRAALASGSVREKTRASRWAVAVGLQAVDQWSVSERLLELAHQHTTGHLTLEAVRRRGADYWLERRTEETTLADKTAVNIVGFLSEKRRPCRLTVTDYLRVHAAVFAGVFPFAGTIRTCNLTKAEPVLAGDTVRYADCREIAAALDYDLSQERRFSYVGLDESGTIRHLAAFAANLWQIHAFRERSDAGRSGSCFAGAIPAGCAGEGRVRRSTAGNYRGFVGLGKVLSGLVVG